MNNPQLQWIVSYPRSGSTWMRYIFAGLCYGVGYLDRTDDLVPWRHKDVTSQEFTKTHRGKPFKHKRIVYLLRHPVDICASAYNFSLLKGVEVSAKNIVAEFLKYGGTKKWAEKGVGAWDEHVTRWLASDNEILVVRYEDLCDRPVRKMRRISKYIGGAYSPTKVARATTAKAMRAIEERAIKNRKSFFYQAERKLQYKRGRRFITRATYGRAGEVFTAAQIKKLCKRFAPTLKMLDYRKVY